MTVEELREEAKKLGYTIQKSQKGVCTCCAGREYQLSKGRKACLNYEFEFVAFNGKGNTHCRRIEVKND